MHNLNELNNLQNIGQEIDLSANEALRQSFSQLNDFEVLKKIKNEFEYLCLNFDPFGFDQINEVKNLLTKYQLQLPMNPYLSTKILLTLLHTLEDQLKKLGH